MAGWVMYVVGILSMEPVTVEVGGLVSNTVTVCGKRTVPAPVPGRARVDVLDDETVEAVGAVAVVEAAKVAIPIHRTTTRRRSLLLQYTWTAVL